MTKEHYFNPSLKQEPSLAGPTKKRNKSIGENDVDEKDTMLKRPDEEDTFEVVDLFIDVVWGFGDFGRSNGGCEEEDEDAVAVALDDEEGKAG
ncbi:hypothetical protein QVD17_19376 [Tagetes erecta]|uniref:Uncharacterized protein n=1 Tax=Tagetes erecta TaxID=13708 RepID=A0AAD8KJC5_TARER|nr:hypothetical protein QVD17_19376 [Tagetes erecta]